MTRRVRRASNVERGRADQFPLSRFPAFRFSEAVGGLGSSGEVGYCGRSVAIGIFQHVDTLGQGEMVGLLMKPGLY